MDINIKPNTFQNEVDMTAPLVDAEDYPRGDIDLYKVRAARQKISCLKNDLNELMKEITTGLEEHFTELKVAEDAAKPTDKVTSTPPVETISLAPLVIKESFAIVDAVTDGSPSYDAGLRAKDELIEFGSLTAKNFQNLQQFADIAQHKLDQRVAVVVKRKRDNGTCVVETIQLVPKKWSGRGYLGMVVRPINKI